MEIRGVVCVVGCAEGAGHVYREAYKNLGKNVDATERSGPPRSPRCPDSILLSTTTGEHGGSAHRRPDRRVQGGLQPLRQGWRW
jgi:hypothetical protein